MKKIIAFLEKPKIIIPFALIVAVIIGITTYRSIGQAPIVTLPSDSNFSTSSLESSSDSIDLAFLKAGRLSSLSVHVGDSETLASLDTSDVSGTLNQAKGALELAKAQYASLNVQYANAKKQQDVLVANAYRTLLSSSLIAVGQNKDSNSMNVVDNNQAPQISGTYICDKEGSYEVNPYASGAQSGFSFTFSGLEEGNGNVAFQTPQPLGECGLFIQFSKGFSSDSVKWVITIPNTRSSVYAANKNAYNLAVTTRDQVLKQLEANLGKSGSGEANIAQAAVDAAQGAYEVALAAYQNSLIVSPVDGTVSFIDSHVKIGELAQANKTLITITKK